MIDYVRNIQQSGMSIYDWIDPCDPYLFIPICDLENILSSALIGLSLNGLPLRTRSKIVKSEVCKALGYSIPDSFQRTQPRFPGQNFDVYTQKSLNVQIWNEEVDINRRYVFLRVNEDDVIVRVRVISGAELINYDRTGTLTHKYQARMYSYGQNICSPNDTSSINRWVARNYVSLSNVNPNQFPQYGELLSISEIYQRLLPLVGMSVDYRDAVQERNRGAELHALVCAHLGYSYYEDDGTYPDIANQLLEIKLQTSPTIDLGLHSPEDGEMIVAINDICFCSEDIRYVVFDGSVSGDRVILQNLYLVTGADFTNYFPLFRGMGTNAKIQLPLPHDFFD